MTPEQLRHDRTVLRERWRDAGWHADATLDQVLRAAALARPGTLFHYHGVDGELHCTAATLVEAGLRLAGGLRALGLQPGDRLAVQMPSSLATTRLYIAALAAGAVLVPIVHVYGAAELGFILRESGARFLAVPRRWQQIDFLQRLQDCGDLPALHRLIVSGDAEALPGRAVAWQQLQQLADGTPVADCGRAADDACLLLYTSGTSARPKGVQHSHNSVRAEWNTPLFDGAGPYFTPFPAGHIAGFNFALRPIVTGTEMVFLDRWDAPHAAGLIERCRVRLTGGTPFHFQAVHAAARQDSRDLSSLVAFNLGGTGVTPDQVHAVDATGALGSRTYGLTEHPTVSVGWIDMPPAARAGSDGRVQPGTEVRTVDDDGNDCSPGADGEIVLRGPEQFIGYTDPALDLQAFLPGGWFRTGDIGRLDAQGVLTVTDRKKDIIIRGGENISSQEVERVLARHPAVAEAAAVAAPDARYGERVCAFVVPRPGAALALAQIQAHFAVAGVARQKTPEILHLVDVLPRTPSGKVMKAELRRRLSGPGPSA